MLIDHLIPDRFEELRPILGRWHRASPLFGSFVSRNTAKIRAKFQGLRDRDDAIDVLCELEVAMLLHQHTGIELEYEPRADGGGRAPDFLVAGESAGQFAIEVRRIREAEPERLLREFQERLVAHARSIPCSLGISMEFHGTDDEGVMTRCMDLPKKLHLATPRILAGLSSQMIECEQNLSPRQQRRWTIPEIQPRVTIRIMKLPGKDPTTGAANLSSGFPIMYSGAEWRKFSDIVCEKLPQLRAGIPNVLAIITHNVTHEEDDLLRALAALNHTLAQRDESFLRKKGFASLAEFLDLAGRLSAVVFRAPFVTIGSDNRNLLWRNGNATHPLPEAFAAHLRGMN